MKRLPVISMGIAIIIVLFQACKKDETAVSPPLPGNEFLTTVQLVITNASDPTDVQTRAVKQLPDQDVDYSNATLTLSKNTSYHVSVKFLDETTMPAGNVTDDIYERRNYHLICFAVAMADLTIKRTDLDTNKPALETGLEDSFTTGAASIGSLNLQLRHQPNAKNGSCDPGSSDADVNFPVIIN